MSKISASFNMVNDSVLEVEQTPFPASMPNTSTLCNIVHDFVLHAKRSPFRTAVVVPVGRDRQGRSITVQMSFKQLNEMTDRYARGFTDAGFRQGDRVLLMIRPGIDLIAVTLSLVKMGAVPVMIDPGMGIKAFSQCVKEARPDCFIGIPQAYVLKMILRRSFRSVRQCVIAGPSWSRKIPSLEQICSTDASPFAVADTQAEDEAVIGFTSGGTGIPKGVVFLHRMIAATVSTLAQDMNLTPGEVHLAAFYVFALFMPSLGVTTIIPDMDPRKTAKVNPALLVEAVQTFGVTNSMGSPIIWEKVADYCLKHKIRLSSFKHVFMFGAEVPPGVVRRFVSVLEGGKAYTPYGATEALPLTNIDDCEIMAETEAATAAGAGVCVGRPIAGARVKIIEITDDPIPFWDESIVLPPGQIGEIAAIGPTVTHTYLKRPLKTAEAKIDSPEGIWHRMGDLGYMDEKGRLWVCGRKVHRVETADGLLTPIQCETIFNVHSEVKRTALVGIGLLGRQIPVLLVEPNKNEILRSTTRQKKLIEELRTIGKSHAHTDEIKEILIYDRPFPVDVRHNTKIQRHKMVAWAERRLK